MNRQADTVFARVYPFEGEPIPQRVADSVIAASVARMRSRIPTLAAAFRREVFAPPVYPPIKRLLMADDGSLWVELRATEQERPYLVLDDAGEVIGTLTVPLNTVVAAVSGSAVWSLERDPDGVQSIVKYRLQRS